MYERAEQPLQPTNNFDRRFRSRIDTISWAAEMLHGSMRTPVFEYAFNGNDLIAQDGGSLSEVFDNGIAEAWQAAERQPDLSFELRRTILERGELDDMLCMARGELPNTLMVASDAPAELSDRATDFGGYNVTRRQTMLRIIRWDRANQKILMQTQSLDGSNRRALEEMFAVINQTVAPGELLGQRKSLDLSEAEHAALLDTLTAAYDDDLADQTGNTYHAGIRQTDGQDFINTYAFAEQQTDIIDWFAEAKLNDPKSAERLRYKFAATMTERFMRRDQPGYQHATTLRGYIGATIITQPALVREIEYATERAERKQLLFSACGITNAADQTTTSQLEQLGFGSASGQDKYGSLKFTCPKGHENTRPRNTLIEHCKTCGTSVRC
jgi:hypothetical protein